MEALFYKLNFAKDIAYILLQNVKKGWKNGLFFQFYSCFSLPFISTSCYRFFDLLVLS